MNALPQADEIHGYYFEDLSVGMTASYAKTITKTDIVLFAGISGDVNPIHQNKEFATKTIDGTAFLLGQEKIQDYNLVVLANVERLTEKIAEEVSAAVEAGTGLLIALGPRCQPESYNLHLYAEDGGPMPIRLQ